MLQMPTFRVYNSEGFVKEMKGAKPKDLEVSAFCGVHKCVH